MFTHLIISLVSFTIVITNARIMVRSNNNRFKTFAIVTPTVGNNGTHFHKQFLIEKKNQRQEIYDNDVVSCF